jgi:hypothetical protein
MEAKKEKQPQMHADKDRIAAASIEIYLRPSAFIWGSSVLDFVQLRHAPSSFHQRLSVLHPL